MNRIIIFICLPLFLCGQELDTLHSHYDCDNVNAYIDNSMTMATLKDYTDTIYPRGSMLLDYTFESDYGNFEDIITFLTDDLNSSYSPVSQSESFLSSDQYTVRYQQYYDGVEVDGGGYTVAFKTSSDPNPSGPCDFAFALTPFIITDINVNVTPTIANSELATILSVEEQLSSSEDIEILEDQLIISHNLNNDCNTLLVYRVSYYSNEVKIGYIDAHTGDVINVRSGGIGLNAPTVHYGQVNLLDRSASGGGYELITPDGSVRTYDFNGLTFFADQMGNGGIKKIDYWIDKIPTVASGPWTTSEASEGVYQAHYTSNLVMGYFESLLQTLNISLGTLFVGADAEDNNAIFFEGFSTNTQTFVAFGKTAGTGETWATFDVVGHEIGHAIINRYLNYNNTTGALHEAIADLLGVYTEYQFQGTIDWKMGDDFSSINRDLGNPDPALDCFDEIRNETNTHDRSVPLGHLFFLLSEGDASLGIPALGLETTLSLVLESLKSLGPNADYEDLREEMFKIIESEFELCSNESIAVRRVWCNICVGPSTFCNFGCNINLSGPSQVCEENDYLQICLSGNSNSSIATKWTIKAKNGLYWVATGNQTGNIVTGGSCLTIVDFPKYPYYPQKAEIKFYSPTLGPEYVVRKRVTLIDCNNDDPTCEEYYGIGNLKTEESDLKQIATQEPLNGASSQNEVMLFRIYDIQGRLLYEGERQPQYEELKTRIKAPSIFLQCTYGIHGNLLSVKKLMFIGN